MKNIFCLCPNPCTDRYMYISELAPATETKATASRSDIGGKGVNVASDIAAYGKPCTLVMLMPEESAYGFERELKARGVRYASVSTRGAVRENLTIVEQSGRETRISETGASLSEAEIKAYCDAVRTSSGVIILSGSVQKDLEEPLFKVLEELSEAGNDIILDSKNAGRKEINSIKPLMVKPNEEEAASFCGFAVKDDASAIAAAEEYKKAGAKNVLLTLGKDGSLLLSESGKALRFYGATVNVRSTVGAGDATVAGFAVAYAEDMSDERCLELSAAFGLSAVTTEGTLPPDKKIIESSKRLVVTERLG